MISWCIEGVEVVKLVIDFRPIGDAETHTAKNVDQFVRHRCQGVFASYMGTTTWQGDIEAITALGERFKGCLTLLKRIVDHPLGFSGGRTDDGALFSRQLADTAKNLTQSAASPGKVNPKLFEGLQIGGSANGCDRLLT
jgi:hypothetical protein